MMQSIMKNYDPAIFESYLTGKVVKNPKSYENERMPPPRQKRDAHADVTDFGGSLNSISHSENGLLISHNSEFYHYLEIV